jgi:hypothetical protein
MRSRGWFPHDGISTLFRRNSRQHSLSVHTKRKSHMSTQQDGSHLPANRRGLRMKLPCPHLHLGLPREINLSYLSHSVCGILLCQPKQIKTKPKTICIAFPPSHLKSTGEITTLCLFSYISLSTS